MSIKVTEKTFCICICLSVIRKKCVLSVGKMFIERKVTRGNGLCSVYEQEEREREKNVAIQIDL